MEHVGAEDVVGRGAVGVGLQVAEAHGDGDFISRLRHAVMGERDRHAGAGVLILGGRIRLGDGEVCRRKGQLSAVDVGYAGADGVVPLRGVAEKLIVDEIRANVLTESNIRDLVKLLDEEMDGVAAEQRQRLETIEEELEDVKKRLSRIWQVIETTDIEMADASERIREHRERKEKLEIAAQEARALLKERRQFLDSADTIATFAEEMSEFLKTSELTETRAFVHSFVKEVEVKPGRAAIVYSIPTPEDSPNRWSGRRRGRPERAELCSTVRQGGPTGEVAL